MNKEKVIKIHLLCFEFISILSLLHGISYLIYYSVIMRFVTTNDFNSMIKASVNFTHNYTQNGLFDVKFNITSIEFEELNEAKVKEVMNAKAPPKPLIYDYKPNNIDDDNYNQHQGFIILAKKYFNVSYSNLIKENHEASTEKFNIINSISNFSSVPNYNLNSNSKDLKTSRGDVYDDHAAVPQK